MKLEAQLISQIKHYLQLHGFYFVRINTGLIANKANKFYRSAMPGTPDICVCIDGKFIGIEAKSPKGKQSEYQKIAQADIQRNQGEYWIIRSLEELMEKIRIFRRTLKA